MKKGVSSGAVFLPVLVLAACACSSRQTNGVFVMINSSNNAVTAFNVEDESIVSTGPAVRTQGSGSGSSTNPLNSQGALAVTRDGKWVIALNAGSNEISVFRVNKNNSITFASKTASLGQFPISVATSGNRVFVLNARVSPNIAGFSVNKNGELTAIDKEKAFRQLPHSSGYTQVGISPNSKWLVVSNESASTLIAYALNGDNIAKSSQTLETNGSGPAAFAFDKRNNLLVVESSSGTASSYSLSNDGIKVITEKLSIDQRMPRWIVCNGSHAYTSTLNSNFVSALAVNDNGQLTLENSYSVGANGFTELAINSDGTHLYTYNPRTNAISRFHIETDGKLVAAGSVTDYFGIVAQGIAAS